LFHALAGEPPFHDKNPVRLVLRHASEKPKSLLAVCPDAPPGLQGVLDRLLAKKPAERFANPAEAIKAITPFLSKVAQKAAGGERPELKAFLRWLQTETVEVELPPTPVPSATPAKNSARRDLLADLANSTVDVDLPEWLGDDTPETAGYQPQRAANDFGIDLSAGKPSGGRDWTTSAGKPESGTRNLLLAAIAVGGVAILLLIVVIVLLLTR
jgi:hypothetical protein